MTIIAATRATPASADTMYTVTDLGNIGGDGVYPNAINSYGQVTGTAASAVPGTGYAFSLDRAGADDQPRGSGIAGHPKQRQQHQ